MKSKTNFSGQLKIALRVGAATAAVNFCTLFFHHYFSYPVILGGFIVFYWLTSVFAWQWTILNAVLNIVVFYFEFILLSKLDRILPLGYGLFPYLVFFLASILLIVCNKKILDRIFEKLGVKQLTFPDPR